MSKKPTKTLGEKLTPKPQNTGLRLAYAASVSVLVGAIFGIFMESPNIGLIAGFASAILFLALLILSRPSPHFLLRFDKQGFMGNLKISKKTAVFDGSNIYHFGLDQGIGERPLGALVAALRSEGYRIVCFFDANIYFTLRDNGDFPKKNTPFSIHILQQVFELKTNEIYVVPKGIQADKFIVETLSYMPACFAVTNDRFRDYENNYSFLATDKQWRKGIQLQGRELKLYRHKFKYPLHMK